MNHTPTTLRPLVTSPIAIVQSPAPMIDGVAVTQNGGDEQAMVHKNSSAPHPTILKRDSFTSGMITPGDEVGNHLLGKGDSRILFSRKLSRHSTMNTHTFTNVKVNYWINDPEAKDYLVRLFTCFYALFIVIVGVVMELSNLIAYGTEQVAYIKDLIFAIYMYGASCVVIGYCGFCVFIEHNHLQTVRRRMAKLSLTEGEPEMLTNPSTGSLYLRIGCVIFGLIGVVYYALMALICIFGWDLHTANECNAAGISISLLAAVFVFMQMWFVYCNGKIALSGKARYFISFGLMHLVATDVWLWIRYILYEEAQTIKEIRLASFENSTFDALPMLDPDATMEGSHHSIHADHNTTSFELHVAHDHMAHMHGRHECKGVQCIFGDFSEFMYTCVVEYSLICAGVAFVFWTNCAKASDRETEVYRNSLQSRKMRKRNMITIDCSRTAQGLFIGFIFLIFSILSVALYNAYATSAHMSQVIFLSTNVFFHSIALFVSCFAFWQMKVLAFNSEQAEEDESAEFLDELLLVVGLIGELVMCLGGMLAFINGRFSLISILLVIVNGFRLVQVALQSALLIIGSRLVLDTENPMTLRYKPGKQVITLLLIINIALFFMNIFEAQKAGVTDEVVRMYGSRSWALVVRGCSPLTIFYRFHSSVCFAEIWKKTFKVKRARGRSI